MAYVAGRVQDCETGHGLGAVLTTNVEGLGTTDNDGFFHTYNAYPGYTVTAGAYGYLEKTYVFKATDIQAGWVTICLNINPEGESGGASVSW